MRLERRQFNSELTARLAIRLAGIALLAATLASTGMLTADDASDSSKTDGKQTAKEALAEFNALIGGWRGVGQPKRGSREGAWIESAEWVWDFTGKSPAVRYDVEKGKLLKQAVVTYEPEQQAFRLESTLPDESKRDYTGKWDDNKLVLESQPDADDYVHRITVTPLNAKRTLVLYERRRADQKFYLRVAEVGYTREGTSLAVSGAGELECIVTGGKGTIAVSHQGKTYYVCCSGCKQAFDDDPEGILAEYRERLAEKRKQKP